MGQRLLDLEEQKKHRKKELENVEEQLQQCMAKSQITDSELQYPFLCGCVGCLLYCLLVLFHVGFLNSPPGFCSQSWRV